MNVGLRALLVLAALVLLIIAIFSDLHQGDLIAAGLACYVGAVLVGDLGLDRALGGRRRA